MQETIGADLERFAMSPRTKLFVFGAIGALLALAIGSDLANESYGLAILVAIAVGWLAVRRSSPASPDTWLLALLMVGYVVGNRGFAQMQPAAQIPLLPAEAALLVAIPMLLVRMALKKTAGFIRDGLNYSVMAWILLGTIRLPMDIHTFGVMALRDFATLYYACFFFVSQDLGRDAGSLKLLKSSLTLSFVVLIPVVVSILISPDFLVYNFTYRGIPIIFQKSDLIATSLAAGFFWLWTRWLKSGSLIWPLAAAASLTLVGAMESPRAGMFAIGITTLVWLLFRRWRIAVAELATVSVAMAVGIAVVLVSGRDLKTSKPYSIYEHALSIFDPAGTGTYINAESGDPGGNNRFRLIWWRDVAEDTLSKNPLMGQGFGSDLSTRFLADYDLLSDETFAARSPHSIVMTVIGRMGLLGLAAWIGVLSGVAALLWRHLKQGDPDGMGLASVAAVICLSACFGVVLEGPMGAVVFWSVLGLANSQAPRKEPNVPVSP